jgi:predicted acylesterase/phospholipase RssA
MEGNQNTTGNSRIALCLSGGGFRATLFHLGVIKALREETGPSLMPLKMVEEVYAVSGGSILAAHMLVNWSRYIDPDETVFAEVENEIRAFAAWNIRDRILRRWFLTRWIGRLGALASRVPVVRRFTGRKAGLFSRTYWLQKQYESKKLVGKIGLGEATTMIESLPKFHFLSTSFRTGELCSFSGDRFEIEGRDVDPSMTQSIPSFPASTPCGHLRLSFAVAASSAFPPMFPPIELTEDQLANPKSEEFLNSISLSDGGVYDNLGIEKFRRNMARDPKHPAKLIISDAGGSFRASAEKNYDNLIARNVRASDILMQRVGEKLKADISQLQTVEDVTVRISDTIANSDVDEAIQQRLRLVRTDLDRFSGKLADLLVGHGARLAKAKIAVLYPSGKGGLLAATLPSTTETEDFDPVARAAANRSFGSLFFGWDWTVAIFVPIFLAALAVLPGALAFGACTYLKNQEQAKDALNRVQNAGTAFAELRDKCLETKMVCERRDYEKLANELRVALKDARKAVNISQPTRSPIVETGLSDSSPGVIKQASVEPQHPQKIYVQFAGLMTREEINALYSRLRVQGWAMQGSSGERVAVAYGLNEVRYSGGKENRTAANALAAAVNEASIAGSEVKVKESRIIQENVLELWISR